MKILNVVSISIDIIKILIKKRLLCNSNKEKSTSYRNVQGKKWESFIVLLNALREHHYQIASLTGVFNQLNISIGLVFKWQL